MRIISVDSGSCYTKALLLEDGEVLSRATRATGARPAEVAEELKRELGEADLVVATGYGRRVVEAQRVVNEITALGVAGGELAQEATLIDIGGQDSKVVSILGGRAEDFVMNDKCSAGTGRFLEVMSRALEVPMERMGSMSLGAQEVVVIDSVCTVFAESEVISHLSSGCRLEDILAGVYRSIATRVRAMVERVGLSEPVLLVGGTARDVGLVEALGHVLGCEVRVPPYPEFMTAYGAGLAVECVG